MIFFKGFFPIFINPKQKKVKTKGKMDLLSRRLDTFAQRERDDDDGDDDDGGDDDGDDDDDDGDDAAAPTPSPLPATYRVEEAEAEEECFGGRKKNALWCSESSLSRRRRRQSLGGRGGTGGAESREKRGERNNVEFFFFFFFFFLFFFVVVGFEMGVGEENGRCERRRRSRSSAAPWLHHCGPDGHAVWIRLRCVQFQSHRKTVRD